MPIVSIATKKSRDLIKSYNKAEKNGEEVDWVQAFREIHEAEAKGKDQQIRAIMEKKR